MGQRSDLHAVLLGITSNVYFQPPENLRMEYPCIVYKRDRRFIGHANNKPYKHAKRYMVTIIDQDPDSEIPERVAELPTSTFVRHFVVDQLNHDNYSLYF